jgi:hypothetical protein
MLSVRIQPKACQDISRNGFVSPRPCFTMCGKDGDNQVKVCQFRYLSLTELR